MRKLDKVIDNLIYQGNLEKAIDIANTVGYSVEVYDGDLETGMLEPEVYISKEKVSQRG